MTVVNELKRKTKNGYSLYLDYRVNGKRIQERTGLSLLDGKDTKAKMSNKDTLIRFRYLLVEKQKQLMDGVAETPMAIKRQKVDFISYFEKYMVLNPSKERRGKATLNKLKAFHINAALPITTITEEYLRKFKNYLEAELTGETPYHYFKYLKMVIKQATKEKLFSTNPAVDIIVPCKANAPKVSLTIEEIRQLYNASCPNEMVKNAFLFSCVTGLRFCDIQLLTWGNIDETNVLRIVQAKTNHPLRLQLVDFAVGLMGARGERSDKLFTLPTNNGTNKSISKWAENAHIDKKVTYHCARHSFATNLHSSGVDIYVT